MAFKKPNKDNLKKLDELTKLYPNFESTKDIKISDKTVYISAVDEDFLHLFAVGCNFTVRSYLHTGKALQQVLDHGVGLGLIGVGIELDGVLFDHDGCLDAHDHSLLEQDGIGVHGDHTHVDVAAILTNRDMLDQVVVAQVGETQQVLARLHTLDVEYTIHVGGSSLDHCAIFCRPEQPYGCLHEFGGVL